MDRFNRAERRVQTARLKTKRKHYWGYGRSYGQGGTSEMTPSQLGKVVQYPHPCSCVMCRNDRSVYGRSLKEIVQMIDEQEGIMSIR